MHGQQAFDGCFNACGTTCSADGDCDWVCPQKPDFVDRVREVGGLRSDSLPLLPLCHERLPSYIPMVRHGSRRSVPFPGTFAALSLEDMVRGSRTGYRPIELSADGIRSRFQLRQDAKLLVVSVARDRILERYWALRSTHRVPAMLAKLGVMAVTIPNFSWFQDAPRPHTLWNRRRMEIVAREFSDAGISVVPHLNSIQPEDWEHWHDLLIRQPDIRYVAKEFQTGLRVRAVGEAAIHDLAQLQDNVGRPLHPIVVGGAGYARIFRKYFEAITVVDSQPFMKSVFRRNRASNGQWELQAQHRSIETLLESNVNSHAAFITAELNGGRKHERTRRTQPPHSHEIDLVPSTQLRLGSIS